jgi:hypothetical protein
MEKPTNIERRRNPFIGPPFQDCPECGRRGSYGVFLTVSESDYRRRCTECGHESRIELPSLEKKLVYLDQFAISSMAAAIKAGDEDRWSDLWTLLDRLVHLQLIACPASLFHYEESVVWKFYESTRSFYERLSAGLAFEDYEVIRRFQLHSHAVSWAAGRGSEAPAIDLGNALIGDRTTWQPRLLVGARLGTTKEEIEELRRLRDEVATGMGEVFKRWQSEKPTYEEIFEEESHAYGRSIIQVFSQHLQELIDAGEGHAPPMSSLATAPTASVVIMTVRDALVSGGIDPEEASAKAYEYLLSNTLQKVPFNWISSSLYASIARKAAGGQKKLPTRGLANDIRMVSSLLPYCDVMFLDKECVAHLQEAPTNELLERFETVVYSLSSLDAFTAYLAEIEKSPPAGHLDLVAEFYGPP